MILKEQNTNYDNALKILNIKNLKQRREILCAKFAIKTSGHQKTKYMFKKNIKEHKMKLRNKNKFKETKTKTNRLHKSSIPYMERLLNNHFQDKEKINNLI